MRQGKYSQPSIPTGSIPTDSNSHRSKILAEKNFQKVPKKRNLYLLYVGNYLHSIYIEFTTLYIVLGIISNLEVI